MRPDCAVSALWHSAHEQGRRDRIAQSEAPTGLVAAALGGSLSA
jgi:hypothetical protein